MNRATVVITGASAGVGRAAVRKFARHGARIGLLARGVDGLTAAQREVEKLGGEALVIPTDVANAEQVEAAAAAIEAQLGEIDIWINNAMTSVFSPIKQMTAEEFRRVTEVTYLGYVYGTLAALKRMLPRDRGVIVQVGSALAYRGIPLQAAYCAARHALAATGPRWNRPASRWIQSSSPSVTSGTNPHWPPRRCCSNCAIRRPRSSPPATCRPWGSTKPPVSISSGCRTSSVWSGSTMSRWPGGWHRP